MSNKWLDNAKETYIEDLTEFKVVDWVFDNFDAQEREDIKDMSRQIAMNKYLSEYNSDIDISFDSDGSSEPFDEWDFSSEYVD
jgi:Mg2+/Co2+ transporter CorC